MKKILKRALIPLLLLLSVFTYYIFTNNRNVNESWPEEGQHIQITSTVDSTLQDAYFYPSTTEDSPLIVSLHQWSASYDNYDDLVTHAIENDWNYIRPDFRGPNNRPEAGGSDLVISDIDDSIEYAIANGNVDENNIYVIGASGGGHAGLLHMMLSEKEVSSYSIWVPITDLVAWYGESKVRQSNYDEDILAITSSQDNSLNVAEALRRSPIYYETPVDKLRDTTIKIYAGINDGYDGAVPISHSTRFFHKLINEFDFGEGNFIPNSTESELVYTQNLIESTDETASKIGERDIIYENSVENISITIFDGDHEILVDEAFEILLNLD